MLWCLPPGSTTAQCPLLGNNRCTVDFRIPSYRADVVYGLRTMSVKELADIGRLEGEHKSGLEMLTYTAEPVRFMPWMMKRWYLKTVLVLVSSFIQVYCCRRTPHQTEVGDI